MCGQKHSCIYRGVSYEIHIIAIIPLFFVDLNVSTNPMVRIGIHKTQVDTKLSVKDYSKDDSAKSVRSKQKQVGKKFLKMVILILIIMQI